MRCRQILDNWFPRQSWRASLPACVVSAGLAGACLAAPASVNVMTVGELREACKAGEQVKQGWVPRSAEKGGAAIKCLAYLAGIADSQVVAKAVTGRAAFCIPDSVSKVQMAAMYVHLADASPQSWRENAVTLMIPVFAKDFPCDK